MRRAGWWATPFRERPPGATAVKLGLCRTPSEIRQPTAAKHSASSVS
jgi:hypothetical protein